MTDVPKLFTAERAEVRLTTTDPELGRVDRRITRSLVLLGSRDHCDVMLASERIDPVHAAIVLLGNTAYLCDLGAPSGTSLNGRRIRWARLADGDEMAIGRFKLNVSVMEDADAVSGEQPEFQLTDEDTIGAVKSIDPVLIVGSDPSCDVVLFDEHVAARHCLVIWTQDGPVLRSLQGRKDVRLNGRPVNGGSLTSGDTIGIGGYELYFEIELCPESMQAEETRGRVMQQASLPADQVMLMSDPRVDPLEIVSGRLTQDNSQDVEYLWPPSADAEDAADASIQNANAGRRPMRPAGEPAEEKLVEESQALRSRVAAAQEALDARAQRHWEKLSEERRRLAAYQRQLHEKAKELLDAARANVKLRRDRAAAIKTEASAARLHKAAGGERVPATAPAVSANESAANLQARAARLATMIKEERENIDSAESRFEAMRLEIERLRAFIEQADEKFQRQNEELGRRAEGLKISEAEIRGEREKLIARIRELDARFASGRTRLDEVNRNRIELDREGERLSATREKLAHREDELHIGRERETARVQKRQAELRKKAAELAKAARDKRTQIEAEIAQRQAMLDEREAELRAHRAALAEAGRAEMERTAADLERVLTARQMEAARRQQTTSKAKAAAETGTRENQANRSRGSSNTAGTNPSPLAAHIAQVKESMAEAGQLDALQEEVYALRSALRQMGDEQSTPANERENQSSAAQDRVNRQSTSEGKTMRSDFAEKEALLRTMAEQTDDDD